MEQWRKATVASRSIEAEEVVSIELVPADGIPFPEYDPGAHIDLRLPGGVVRQYSLCGLPDRGSYRIAVLRDPRSRGGSAAVHDQIAIGATIEIGVPRNLFGLAAVNHRSLLIAGGIGITPILAMARHLDEVGIPFELHYAARSRARAAFYSELRSSAFQDQVTFYFDDEGAEKRLRLEAVLKEPAQDRHLYVCGPPGLIDAAMREAAAAGWPSDHVHREVFSAPEQPATTSDQSFELVLQRSGLRLTVAADQTAIQALTAAGIEVPVSCEQGICGTCLTPVLAGAPDHRDLFMSDAEHARNDSFTPCCSRALTATLLIDL